MELMRNRARTLIYSTGLPPSIVAASIAALEVIEREPDYAALPVKGARLHATCRLPDAQSPIVPVVIGDEDRARGSSRLWRTKASSSSPSARRRCPPAPRACG